MWPLKSGVNWVGLKYDLVFKGRLGVWNILNLKYAYNHASETEAKIQKQKVHQWTKWVMSVEDNWTLSSFGKVR